MHDALQTSSEPRIACCMLLFSSLSTAWSRLLGCLQCMQSTPQVYMHDALQSSFEPGIVVQPSGVVHRGCPGLPIVDVHPYFMECHDAHQIVVSGFCQPTSMFNKHSPLCVLGETGIFEPM